MSKKIAKERVPDDLRTRIEPDVMEIHMTTIGAPVLVYLEDMDW